MNVANKIRELCAIVHDLEAAYPGRKFTLDGHLVGSIGEVFAAERYGIKLHPASAQGHDGVLPDGRQVQIKTTQVKMIGLRECPQVLLVLQILPNGSLEEVYFGEGQRVWEGAGPLQRNGQRPLSLSKLRRIKQIGAAHSRPEKGSVL